MRRLLLALFALFLLAPQASGDATNPGLLPPEAQKWKGVFCPPRSQSPLRSALSFGVVVGGVAFVAHRRKRPSR